MFVNIDINFTIYISYKKIKTRAAQMNAFAFLQQKGLNHKYNDLLLMTSKSKKCRI